MTTIRKQRIGTTSKRVRITPTPQTELHAYYGFAADYKTGREIPFYRFFLTPGFDIYVCFDKDGRVNIRPYDHLLTELECDKLSAILTIPIGEGAVARTQWHLVCATLGGKLHTLRTLFARRWLTHRFINWGQYYESANLWFKGLMLGYNVVPANQSFDIFSFDGIVRHVTQLGGFDDCVLHYIKEPSMDCILQTSWQFRDALAKRRAPLQETSLYSTVTTTVVKEL